MFQLAYYIISNNKYTHTQIHAYTNTDNISMDYTKKSQKELKDLCKEKNISGYNNMDGKRN